MSVPLAKLAAMGFFRGGCIEKGVGDDFNMINQLTPCQKWLRFFLRNTAEMINPTTAKRDQNLISLYRKTAKSNIKVVRKK